MTLEGIVVTSSTLWTIRPLLRQMRAACDKVTVLVDEKSEWRTPLQMIAEENRVDRLVVRKVDYIEQVLTELYNEAECDWVLRLDDDELLSDWLGQRLPDLMSDSERQRAPDFWRLARAHLTDDHHYLMDGFIQNGPKADWWPNFQLRLFKKGHCRHEGKVHEGPQGIGTGLNSHYPILHYALSMKSYDERKAQVERYRAIDPTMVDRGTTLLWEDYHLTPKPCPFVPWAPWKGDVQHGPSS